jgi:putative acetyltransferase
MIIRPIQPSDNLALASIIRESIESLGLPTEGTAHSDPTTDDLFKLFQCEKSYYWVLEIEQEVVGGCGIYPTYGLPNGCCELVRFFLKEKVRGKGYGKILMQKSEETAIHFGFSSIYLESFPDMKAAIALYEKYNYQYLSNSLGETGHHACNVWMLKTF